MQATTSPSAMSAIHDDAAKSAKRRYHGESEGHLLASVAIGARVAREPGDDTTKLVRTTDATLRVLGDPLVDQPGLIVHEGTGESL